MKSINLYIEEFIFELKNKYTYLNEDSFTPRDAIFFEIIPRLCSDQIYIELLSKTKIKRIKDNLDQTDFDVSCP